jgi:hypothetical protein
MKAAPIQAPTSNTKKIAETPQKIWKNFYEMQFLWSAILYELV